MWNAHLFGTGQWQWDALKGPPFNALFYTPVWYLIMGRVTNIFGDSLVVGRIFNLVDFRRLSGPGLPDCQVFYQVENLRTDRGRIAINEQLYDRLVDVSPGRHVSNPV